MRMLRNNDSIKPEEGPFYTVLSDYDSVGVKAVIWKLFSKDTST